MAPPCLSFPIPQRPQDDLQVPTDPPPPPPWDTGLGQKRVPVVPGVPGQQGGLYLGGSGNGDRDRDGDSTFPCPGPIMERCHSVSPVPNPAGTRDRTALFSPVRSQPHFPPRHRPFPPATPIHTPLWGSPPIPSPLGVPLAWPCPLSGGGDGVPTRLPAPRPGAARGPPSSPAPGNGARAD